MTAPGTSRLQFTVLPPIDWVINYAFLPRMRMQGQRQTIERHSASPLSSQALPRSAFLQLCLVGRQADTSETRFIHLQLHSQVKCHHISPWVFPPRLIPKSSLSWVRRGEDQWHWTDQIPNFSCPVLGVLSIHPTPGLLPHHPVLRVPSPSCEGTPARAPPAGPRSALRRPMMLGSRAP